MYGTVGVDINFEYEKLQKTSIFLTLIVKPYSYLVDDLLGNGGDSSGAEPVGVHEDV
jgi:hypothetical protein